MILLRFDISSYHIGPLHHLDDSSDYMLNRCDVTWFRQPYHVPLPRLDGDAKEHHYTRGPRDARDTRIDSEDDREGPVSSSELDAVTYCRSPPSALSLQDPIAPLLSIYNPMQSKTRYLTGETMCSCCSEPDSGFDDNGPTPPRRCITATYPVLLTVTEDPQVDQLLLPEQPQLTITHEY
ncbi:hypothetical protein G7046_g2762 [Stylonectria norvegica]|nr:hypothetical protein G7046_g2762 [Stylonectria norvegica]